MCTPIILGDMQNLPGAKLPNGVPINGGQALPEDRVPAGGTATPPTNAELVTSDNGTKVNGPPTSKDSGRPVVDPASAGPADTSGGTGDPIADQNTTLINSLTTMAHQYSDTTADILRAQRDATAALTAGFLDLNKSQKDALDAANQLRQNTGQASRKPSYSLSMAKVQRANSQGAASTMLTGPAGVPVNQLALGRAQLLGGAAA